MSDPMLLASVGAGVMYAVGLRRLSRAGHRSAVGPVRAAAFLGGVAALVVASWPALHEATGRLFAPHMLQHLLLAVVAPPLLAAGRADVAFGAALPALRAPFRRAARAAGAPLLVIWLVHVGVMWAWHAPPLYEGAVRSDLIHVLEHLTMFGSAMWLWWHVVGVPASRRPGPGAGVLASFTLAVQGTVLGALITLSPRPWYGVYGSLEDQQLAGLLMWVPAGMIYGIAALLLLGSHLRASESRHRDERPAPRGPVEPRSARMAIFLSLAALLLASCAPEHGPPEALADADPDRAVPRFAYYGCTSCHVIDGIRGARGTVGPSLVGLSERRYIAGSVPNEPESVAAFIRNPSAFAGNTIMPSTGLSEQEAQDMAAYLLRDRGGE